MLPPSATTLTYVAPASQSFAALTPNALHSNLRLTTSRCRCASSRKSISKSRRRWWRSSRITATPKVSVWHRDRAADQGIRIVDRRAAHILLVRGDQHNVLKGAVATEVRLHVLRIRVG